MTTRVKICGINSAIAMDAAVEAGADYVGFNFFPPSPRVVTPAQAAALSKRHPGGPAQVGLFVDPSDDDVAAVLAAVALDVLQIYGAPGRAASLRSRFGIATWATVGVSGVPDLPPGAPGVDGLLIEAKAPPGAVLPGGNAQVFDWSVLHGWAAPTPWMLAGGLTPDNVGEAVRISGAPAVDVSSGVERSRGVKDPALIRAFVRNAQIETSVQPA